MELQCDPGYSPIDGKSSALCFDSLSFTDLSLPVFGCEGKLNRICHRSLMQSEKSQPEDKRIMPETRFIEFPALTLT